MKWKAIEIHTLSKKKKVREDKKISEEKRWKRKEYLIFFFVPWWIVIFRIKLQTSNKLKTQGNKWNNLCIFRIKKELHIFFTQSKHSNIFLDYSINFWNHLLHLESINPSFVSSLSSNLYNKNNSNKRKILLFFSFFFQHLRIETLDNYCGGRNRDRHPTRCEYLGGQSY